MRVFKKSKFWKKTALALLTAAVVFLFALGMGPFGSMGLSLQAEAAGDVVINETNFPDEIFRVYVSENFDSDGDGNLSVSERASVTDIYVSDKGITSLKGVEYFTGLEELYCNNNQLTSLDVSKNTALEFLNCQNTQLTSLDVNKNTALKTLWCDNNELTSLDVSKNTALKSLVCFDNQLTSLDVSQNTALWYLSCSNNQLTSLDVSNCTSLLDFNCSGNGHNIGKVGDTYSLTNLPDFDASKTSNWTGVAYDSTSNSLKDFTSETITYTYDCGNGKSAIFTLQAQLLSPQEQQLRAFVSRMYTVALGREAETDGLDFYTDRLLAGDSNGACLAESFLTSPEFKGKGYDDAQYVKVLYRTFFDREPAAEEVNYWVEKLASGQPRAFVLSGFVNSVEFDNLCTSYGISRGFMKEDGKPLNPGIGRFVERFYTVVLERAGEKEGIEYWSLQIANGKCTPKDAAKSFFLSEEYINKNTSDEKYIITLYKTFMDREPEDGGIEYWQGVLNGGATREQILEGFADSAEFQGIMAGFGL